MADSFAVDLIDAQYLLASIRHIRAFLFVWVGDEAAARIELEQVDLPPLPSDFRESGRLHAFFTQLPKGMMAALELKDGASIRRITAGALETNDGSSAEIASVGEQFIRVVVQRNDVPKFRDSWWTLIDFIHMLFPAYATARQFRSRITQGAEPRDLVSFIDSLIVS